MNKTDTHNITTKLKVDFLSDPSNYPEGTTSVEVIETHFSWIFLGDQYVYKMKRPIQKDLFDLRSLPKRASNCKEELRLNNRMAPHIYIDVLPLNLDSNNKLTLVDPGTPIEWLIKMHRIPGDNMLDQSIRKKTITIDEVTRTIDVLIRHYRRIDPEHVTPPNLSQFMMNRIIDTRDDFHRYDFDIDLELVDNNSESLKQFLKQHKTWQADRIDNGYVREVHGDLRPEHVCVRPEPTFIDCLEFSKPLRVMDMADEISYLSLECDLLGRSDIADHIITTYKRLMDDPIEEKYIHFFKAYRSMIRARIAIYHLIEEQYKGQQIYITQTNNYLNAAAYHISQASIL